MTVTKTLLNSIKKGGGETKEKNRIKIGTTQFTANPLMSIDHALSQFEKVSSCYEGHEGVSRKWWVVTRCGG